MMTKFLKEDSQICKVTMKDIQLMQLECISLEDGWLLYFDDKCTNVWTCCDLKWLDDEMVTTSDEVDKDGEVPQTQLNTWFFINITSLNFHFCKG